MMLDAVFHDIVICHDIFFCYLSLCTSKSHGLDSRLSNQAHIHVLSKIEQSLFQKRTNLPCTESSFLRLTLEPLFGIKNAYIDCEYIFE